MSTLYEIDRDILACIDMETGEVIDDLKLEALQMEREVKIENVILWVKNLMSDAVAYKAEREAFEKREKQALAKVERLKKWLAYATDGSAFSTARCAVTFRRTKKVEVFNKDAIPKAFMTESVTYSPNKTEIKKAIESGQAVNGCALVENLSATIK